MTRFQALVLLSALCLLRVDALSLRSLVENPFLPQPAHRRLASCPLTSGVDYLGNDIKYVSSVKVTDCCTLCSQTSGCGAFTWTDHQGGTCWLKSAKGNTAANAAATSAVLVEDSAPCTLKDGYDYQGNDIANVQSNNAGACCSICSSWPGCKAFTWTNQNSGTCWLKSKKGSEVPKAGAKSAEVQTTRLLQHLPQLERLSLVLVEQRQRGGTMLAQSAKGQTQYKVGVVSSQMLDNPLPCELEANKDYVGNDIDNVPESKPADCCDKCRARTGCRAFTWSNHNTGTCWLKSGKGSTVTKSGVTSAVVF
ncbi:PAN domain [Phytophthora infestans]|uniref:PAN domain n=1 Tax=Phytophthora infestans TaxID=4787 RepID=A0A833VZ05_PHYIN|nr:PAN domain [Phytophthora infestans]